MLCRQMAIAELSITVEWLWFCVCYLYVCGHVVIKCAAGVEYALGFLFASCDDSF